VVRERHFLEIFAAVENYRDMEHRLRQMTGDDCRSSSMMAMPLAVDNSGGRFKRLVW
jgi:hypothetical protein